jgi:hypothetical protein
MVKRLEIKTQLVLWQSIYLILATEKLLLWEWINVIDFGVNRSLNFSCILTSEVT